VTQQVNPRPSWRLGRRLGLFALAGTALGTFGPPGTDTLVVSGAGGEARAATLPEVLESAGRYVAALEESFLLLRAKEHCVQTQWVGGGYERHRYLSKTLDSDVLWVPGGDPLSWAFYRDVQSVDGKQVRDREERLARLFAGGVSSAAREGAGRIVEESSRFNLGSRKRNTTAPTLAIVLLHPRYQARCHFDLKKTSKVAGRLAQQVEFKETERPTLFHNTVDGRDQPTRGTFWIAGDDGTVLKSEMFVPTALLSFEVTYGRDPTSGLFVPLEFRDDVGLGTDEEIESVVNYSSFQPREKGVGTTPTVR
jgi:hypothetical protein